MPTAQNRLWAYSQWGVITMKLFLRILSYVATALAACAVTLFFCANTLSGSVKLSQVEYLIESCFIGSRGVRNDPFFRF